MTNVGQLNKHLQELATLERSLWNAFKKTEEEYLPPIAHPVRSVKTANELIRTGFLQRRHYYPIYLFLSLLSAFAVVLLSFWYLVPYSTFLVAAMTSRSKFVEAYVKSKLGTSKFEGFAFGISQPSLAVAGVIKLREVGTGTLDLSAIQSILKIQKASSDFSEVATGFADVMKKSVYGVPFMFAGWIYGNTATFNKYLALFQDVASKNWFVVVPVALVIFSLAFFSYDLVLGQTFVKRRKKKYLLVLTLIAESFVQGRK